MKEQKIPLKCCQPLNFLMFFKRFRSYIAVNMKSVGQRALKLLAAKVGVLKKNSAALAIPAKLCASAIGLGSRSSGVESFSKFKGQ